MSNILKVLVGALHSKIGSSILESVLSIGSSSGSSVSGTVSNVIKTWTDAEIGAAESDWAKSAKDSSASAAFVAGANWAVSHQAQTLEDKVADAVAAHTSVPESVVKDVEGDVIDVAEEAVTSPAAAAVTAVEDVAKVVEEYKAAKDDSSSAAK